MKKIIALVCFPLVLGLTAFLIPAQYAAGEGTQQVPPVSGMTYIPPGPFIMGSDLEDLRKAASQDEYPQRVVDLPGYYIDTHEVTNAQYKVFIDSVGIDPPYLWVDGNYPVGRDGYPVVDVSWYEAAEYARFVGKRLPTEAEWEKAARGTDGRRYPWGDKFNKHLVEMDGLVPVMSIAGNVSPFGVRDMAGNAAEWVDDWYAPYPREDGQEIPPEITTRVQTYSEEKYKVYRGGGFNTFGKYLRCANREKEKPDQKWRYIGFRCAMDGPRDAPGQ
ncbi:MAG: formylglycine-generating enzyme family protein [Candidatus Latescibacterota bacterium]|jgi:formylglycine-generating enzyme required for sulfatase activity